MQTGRSTVRVRDVEFGGDEVVLIAGPCSVESETQLLTVARAVRDAGARMLRGGAFKPRTSPDSFRGLGEEGLKLLALARAETGLPVVTEVMDPRLIPLVSQYADMLQVGSRNMQNFPLLEELGRSRVPVLLKRGMGSTIDELLSAAEYLFRGGNDQVVFCERGIRTFEPSTRSTLDLNAVPMLRRRSLLPVIVDPSHGTGHAWMVPSLASAAVAVRADGLIIEVHANPALALSDGAQSVTPAEFDALAREVAAVATAIGRHTAVPCGAR